VCRFLFGEGTTAGGKGKGPMPSECRNGGVSTQPECVPRERSFAELTKVLASGVCPRSTYGIFATPVAFLIDEQRAISSNVAKGMEEILALAPDGLVGRGEEVSIAS
jgi:hypothetical protein